MTINASGMCQKDYEPLKKAFENNFREYDEVGASIALVKNGELVVDLYAGYKDSERLEPWDPRTVANVWSTTKGVVGICFAILVDRGVLSYQSKLSEYWPEFDTDLKRDITLAMLLSHQSGLCGFRHQASPEDLFQREAAALKLATMEPFWNPGEAYGYHAISVGILASEFMVRVTGKSLKTFVNEELAKRFNLDISIGLDRSQYDQVATMLAPADMQASDLALNMTEIQNAALNNPPLMPDMPNTEAWRDADIPSANGFSTATALAKLYGALSADGYIGDIKLLSTGVIEEATTVRTGSGVDMVLQMPGQWACGFLKNSLGVYGPNPNAYGHSGWGGSFAFADPDQGIGFAYTMNKMGTELIGDPRNLSLVAALYESLS